MCHLHRTVSMAIQVMKVITYDILKAFLDALSPPPARLDPVAEVQYHPLAISAIADAKQLQHESDDTALDFPDDSKRVITHGLDLR